MSYIDSMMQARLYQRKMVETLRGADDSEAPSTTEIDCLLTSIPWVESAQTSINFGGQYKIKATIKTLPGQPVAAMKKTVRDVVDRVFGAYARTGFKHVWSVFVSEHRQTSPLRSDLDAFDISATVMPMFPAVTNVEVDRDILECKLFVTLTVPDRRKRTETLAAVEAYFARFAVLGQVVEVSIKETNADLLAEEPLADVGEAIKKARGEPPPPPPAKGYA